MRDSLKACREERIGMNPILMILCICVYACDQMYIAILNLQRIVYYSIYDLIYIGPCRCLGSDGQPSPSQAGVGARAEEI